MINAFDQQRLVETVLYLLNKTGGLDAYHVFKVLYLAEREHLAKWGESLVPDDFRAFKHGPVPVNIYFADQKRSNKPEHDRTLIDGMTQSIEHAGEDDARYFWIATRQPDMEYFSLEDIATLDEAIDKYATMPFAELEKLVHDLAWRNAYHGDAAPGDVMSPVDMAKEAGATAETLAYITDRNELERACR